MVKIVFFGNINEIINENIKVYDYFNRRYFVDLRGRSSKEAIVPIRDTIKLTVAATGIGEK